MSCLQPILSSVASLNSFIVSCVVSLISSILCVVFLSSTCLHSFRSLMAFPTYHLLDLIQKQNIVLCSLSYHSYKKHEYRFRTVKQKNHNVIISNIIIILKEYTLTKGKENLFCNVSCPLYLVHWTIQSALHSTLTDLFISSATRLQPCCNYCSKTIITYVHEFTIVYSQVLIYTKLYMYSPLSIARY